MVSLRPAVSQDLPSAAAVAAQAMLDDELFAFLCPQRREYYSDYRDGFLRRLQTKHATPGWVVMVAIKDSPITGAELVGYGVWERIGTDASATRWRETKSGWWDALERMLVSFTDRFTSRMYPDRSVDSARLALYNQASARDCFPFDDHPELWYLSSLAVDPSHQRQGIGRKLVGWGLEQASRDKVPVGLEASAKGTRLYEQLGFCTVNDGELVSGIVMRAMLYNPASEQTTQSAMKDMRGTSECGGNSHESTVDHSSGFKTP